MWQSVKIRQGRYEQVRELARVEGRSVANMLDRLLDGALAEPVGHGRQGDPGRAEAKSLPEFRPETPPGSASAPLLPDPPKVPAIPGLKRASELPGRERRMTDGAAKDYCVHRVKLDSFCKRCANGEPA